MGCMGISQAFGNSSFSFFAPLPTEKKLEKNEEATLLSWEIYLKENYLQSQQYQLKQRTDQKIEDMGNK